MSDLGQRGGRPKGIPDCICANCISRPVMDHSDICEECHYDPPRYSELWWIRHGRRQEQLRALAMREAMDSTGGLF